jgi:hypothetical protein
MEGADRYVQGICYRFNGQGQGVFALMQAKKHAYLFIQDLNMPTEKYLLLLQSKALMSVQGAYGRSFAKPALIKAELVTAGVMAYSRWRCRWLQLHPLGHDLNQPHKLLVLHALRPSCSPSAGIIRLMQDQ